MRIQIIEDGYVSHIYGSALKIGFHNLGHEVLVTQWSKEVRDKLYCRSSGLLGGLSIVALKIQNKFRFGRYLKEIQQKIINDYLEFRPDLVFIYRGTHVCPRTIDFMKVDGCASVFGYNNDDPFSSDYSFYFWRSYKKCLSLYDHVFCYRKKNISDYASIGISNTSILKPYYVADYNYFIESIVPNHKIYDVVFIGHFEDDGRDEAILKLCREGFVVKLFGTDWERSSNYPELYEYMGSVEPIFDDYNVVLNRSKIALAFLSKKNNDTYTIYKTKL